MPTKEQIQGVRSFTRWFKPTYLIANYWWYADFLTIGFAKKKVILTHDVWSKHIWRHHPDAGILKDFDQGREFEELAKATDVIAISPEDQAYFRKGHRKVHLISPRSNLKISPPEDKNPVPIMLFVGSNYSANIEAMQWFFECVIPRLNLPTSSYRVRLVGSICEHFTHRSFSCGVDLAGVVEDLQVEYDEASVIILPVRSGTGVKIKLVEALACGKALVTTTEGISGFKRCLRAFLIVHDEPIQFAAELRNLLTNATSRQKAESNSCKAYQECLRMDCDELFID